MDLEMQNVIMAMMAEIVTDRRTSFPWYQPSLTSEAQAKAAWNELPIVYSWNEVITERGHMSFTVSTNGGRVAQMLERCMPRSHLTFEATRDIIVKLLTETRNTMMREMCVEFSMSPRQLSARLLEQKEA